MRRRRLLQAGIATGAMGLVGGLWAAQPRSALWPAVGRGKRAAVVRSVHVVIVGGGLAGMSAAATLAARGVRVTLCERADAVGGKLAGWPIQVDGAEVPMEHGFHGFFRQYYTLLDLLGRAGADRDMVPQSRYPVLTRTRPLEGFRATRLPFPVNLLDVLARSPTLGLADVAGERPGMEALLSYDPARTFAKLDGLDMETWIREGALEGAFADVVLRPFGQASLNALSKFSAAEAIRFFHFYMLGNPEGLGFSALGRGPHLSVLAPLRAYLEGLGVDVRTSTPVRRVRFEGGRAVGVELGAVAFDDRISVLAAQVPATGWLDVGGAFVRRTATGFEARDARCTHMGCPVGLVADGFLCPCHAGRYDVNAAPVAGPPPRALAALDVQVDGDQLRIGAAPPPGEVLAADAVILATEIGALHKLARASDIAAHAPALAAAVAAGGEADPYAVVRYWFDRPVNPDRAAFYTVSEYKWTDSIAVYSAFQEPYTRGPVAVIESHAYAIAPEDVADAARYAQALLAELREIFPELRDAKVTHQEAMTQSNFTRFAPNDFARRPEVATEIPNLFLAGDHVKLPFPAFLMEAAAASGRIAANHILAGEDVVEDPVRTVALRGQLADVFG